MKALDLKHGFSLLELLVVLTVVGVLLGLGTPLLGQFLAERRLDEAAITLSNALRRASDQAVTRSESVTLNVSGSTLSWKGEGDQVLGKASLPNKAALSSPSTILFSGRGLPIQKYDFSVSSGTKQKKIYLLPTGAVMIR